MKKKCKVITGQLVLLWLFCWPIAVLADWQTTLESQFDIVETFDQLQNWSVVSTGYNTDPNDMPKKLDGTNSIWQLAQADFVKAPGAEEAISDHGVDYTWQPSFSETPKSFCLQHNILYETADDASQGWGAQRLGTFFGDGITGKSGYEKIHVFFMLKFRPGYFALRNGTPTGYAYLGYLKFFEMMSGYTGIQKWGTDADRLTAAQTDAVLVSYGTNATVFNFQSGGDTYGHDKILPKEITLTAVNVDSKWKYEASIVRSYVNESIATLYENNSWMGIEAVFDRGTVNGNDGTIDYYLYDSSGNEVAHYSAIGESRMVNFDHYYNRVVLGGNRSLHTGDDAVIPDDTRAYIDDFIIDDKRIGPKYFDLLAKPSSILPPLKLEISN